MIQCLTQLHQLAADTVVAVVLLLVVRVVQAVAVARYSKAAEQEILQALHQAKVVTAEAASITAVAVAVVRLELVETLELKVA